MTQPAYHHLNVNEALELLNSNLDGISSAEAKTRLEKYGENALKNVHKRSKFLKFIDQFKNLMVGILLAAAVVSLVVSILNHESFIDSIAIIAIVILNAVLGYFQEEKADEAVNALSKMQVSMVKVKRDGETIEVPSANIVPGDVIFLEAGDSVPADARLIWQTSLQVDESALTGESVPATKALNALKTDTPLSQRNNMVYSGTNVVNGRAQAVVCVTGMGTQIGLIADSLQTVKKEITPLQQKINDISKVLSIVIFIIIIVMLVVGLVRGQPLMDALMLAVSLAVAAIPEGLSAIITIIMSIGVRDMARKRAIIRVMSSVETLGSTEIICSDKTGTITENKMRIRELYYNGKTVSADELDKTNPLFFAMMLANDAEKNHQKYIGDPTEIALYECLEDYYNLDEFRDHNPRIGEIPFDSERKMMTTVNKMTDFGQYFVWTKGSFDSVISKCHKILEHGVNHEMTDEIVRRLKDVENEKSGKTYRVLAFAYKEVSSDLKIDSSLEEDLVFLGMTAMVDSPRPDVKPAIKACKLAGIRPIMITGDSETTASAIAKEVGIVENDDGVITGQQLDEMDEDELMNNIEKYSVYARVSPMNKLSIVNTWKNKGKIVAMTGDGVNDAPALKAADIGVGMGISGTDVAKAEADVVLMNDSFATIVAAVGEGRKIFDNIKNVLTYLLAGNIAEVLIVFIGMFIVTTNTGEIFNPIQLLYVNLITDSIPAIMLAYEKESDGIMQRTVQKNKKSFFTKSLSIRIITSAVIETLAVIVAYLITKSTTCAFLTLVLSEMAFAYSCRNLEMPIWKMKVNNKNLNISMAILFLVQIIFFFTPAGKIMGIESIRVTEILTSGIIVVVVFVLNELMKSILVKIMSTNIHSEK
ncbi:cation-translocating P-type ATPase [Candidatus Saccharibacteria bacterium]|nr:cation-translocating P-type ATPase [Candidatus Saccharibacteria bacterium]